jgi:hypothetical protein
MRFLIVNTDYPSFIDFLYGQHTGLQSQAHDEQLRVLNHSLFAVADFYSSNLRALGHEAWDIHANVASMQMAWAKEHDVVVSSDDDIEWQFRLRKGIIPWIGRKRTPQWFYTVLEAQIEHYKPDVVLNQSMVEIPCSFWEQMRSRIPILIGQHAATQLSPRENWHVYDLVISSFQPKLDWFATFGIKTALNRLAFEPRVLERLNPSSNIYPIGFVGSFFSVHTSRTALVERLCRHFDMPVWGPNIRSVSPQSSIAAHYQGPAWGVTMYQRLRECKISFNHHGNVAPYANNCRLYEATGVGSALVTDWKPNLHELFDLDQEVVSYRSVDECIEKVAYLLAHDASRAAIAKAGQQRTLRDHTYANRMRELVAIIKEQL